MGCWRRKGVKESKDERDSRHPPLGTKYIRMKPKLKSQNPVLEVLRWHGCGAGTGIFVLCRTIGLPKPLPFHSRASLPVRLTQSSIARLAVGAVLCPHSRTRASRHASERSLPNPFFNSGKLHRKSKKSPKGPSGKTLLPGIAVDQNDFWAKLKKILPIFALEKVFTRYWNQKALVLLQPNVGSN